MNDAQRTGLLGEVYAARYLREQGYQVTAANYRVRAGEVDIVAELNGLYVFAEVKSRRQEAMFAPADAVDFAKGERVRSAAAAFLSAQKIKTDTRFDIIEVIFDGDEHNINHIINAF